METLTTAKRELRDVKAQISELQKTQRALERVIQALEPDPKRPRERHRKRLPRMPLEQSIPKVQDVMRKDPDRAVTLQELTSAVGNGRTDRAMAYVLREMEKRNLVTREGTRETHAGGQPATLWKYVPTTYHPE